MILGHDAVIGHDRKKDLHEYCDELDFTLEYLNPIYTEDKIVSSSAIRKSIYAGELTEASTFLGRPYSIFATVEPGEKKGRALGFHTANLPVEELALPPFGGLCCSGKNKQPSLSCGCQLRLCTNASQRSSTLPRSSSYR